MERSQLLDDIRVLTALLNRAEGHERRVEEADERDDHIDVQINRLEHVGVKLERRMLNLDDPFEDPVRLQAERAKIAEKLERINRKIETLRRAALQNDVLDATAYAARPPAVPARLRQTLFALVKDMHGDPGVPRADIRPFQDSLAHLVRSRRDELNEIAGQVRTARDYLTSTTDIADRLLDTAHALDAIPAASLPFADERQQIAKRVKMAQTQVREAESALLDLAHDWPELSDIAKRPDWKKLPFAQLLQLITPADEAQAARSPATKRFEETLEMLQGLALWLNELEQAVEDAPPPR